MILVDRKLNVTTRTKQLEDLQRWGVALKQNPGFRVRIEVPDAKALRAAERALSKALVDPSRIWAVQVGWP